MDNKKPTYNYAKAVADNKQNSQQDFTVEFGKENTFDQINLTHSEGSKNKPEKSKAKDAEVSEEFETRNNKKSVSRNKKNNRHGNRNRTNEDK